MIGILDYGAGNLKSIWNVIDYLGYETLLVSKSADLDVCSHLIIPGVGSFSHAMTSLVQSGLIEIVKNHIMAGKPTMGICLGMQILASYGEEDCGARGLDFISGVVKPLSTDLCQVPHVGWNSLNFNSEHPVFFGIKKHVDYYFVHSYYFDLESHDNVVATSHYGVDFASVVAHKNIIGLQFHPEKSQDNGLKLLENFCDWDGIC